MIIIGRISVQTGGNAHEGKEAFGGKVAGIFIDNVPLKLLAIVLAVGIFIVINYGA